jgi:hypothetical protein
MSQKIFIQFLREPPGSPEEIIEAPLLENIAIEAKSTFSTFGEMMPGITAAKDAAIGLKATMAGGLQESELNIANKFDLKRWQKTEPVRISTKIAFHSKEDAKKDVFDQMIKLLSYAILSKEDSGGKVTYITPGISAAAMAQIKAGQTSSLPAKLIAFEIPGIVYIPVALIESANPVYSKERTQSGFPLWGTIDLVVTSVYPANTEYFESAADIFRGFGMSELAQFQLLNVAF